MIPGLCVYSAVVILESLPVQHGQTMESMLTQLTANDSLSTTKTCGYILLSEKRLLADVTKVTIVRIGNTC